MNLEVEHMSPRPKNNENIAHPNETIRLLLERASCRNFSDRKISSTVLNLVLEAGIHGPTGGNLQPYSIIKIENRRTKRKLAKMCGQKFIGDTSLLLLFCIDWHRIERWAKMKVAPFTARSSFRHFWISFQDTIICAQNICTAASSLGLGSVYIGTIIELLNETREMFRLPNGVFPVVLLCLGYPKTRPKAREKLGTSVIVHSELYREIEDRKLSDAFDCKYQDRERLKITKKRLETISKVCSEVYGEEFANKCVSQIRKNGYINAAQHCFGLHYRADLLPRDNDHFIEMMEKFGFTWFKKHQPVHT